MKTWNITGKITNAKGEGLSHVTVKAFDLDVNGEDALGNCITDHEGRYIINYTDRDFKKTSKEKGGPELVIKVFDHDNEKQLGASRVKRSAAVKEVINLSIATNGQELGHSIISPIDDYLYGFEKDDIAERLQIGGTEIYLGKEKIAKKRLSNALKKRGIFNKEVLVEMAMDGLSLKEEAKKMKVSELALTQLINYAIQTTPQDKLQVIKEHVEQPKFTGHLSSDDPDYDRFVTELGLDDIPIASLEDIQKWDIYPEIFYWYFGAIAAVDLRPYFGDARNQGGRGSCTAFCSTAVVEGMEYFRDPRNQPINLSEELTFWYSKRGQLFGAGGYSGFAALRHYAEYGGCEEAYLPYNGTNMGSNYVHLPVPDEAMDRAQFYKNGQVVALPARDIAAVKETLKTGRCVGLVSGVHGWSTSTGTVTMPNPLDSKGIGSSHCTTIIGFIDRNDLHKDMEGGFFIVRNSWGGANSTAHQLGPEYGGHLLMPYGWYRRYSHSAFTMIDHQANPEHEKKWLVEYYDNKHLMGSPLNSVQAKIKVFLINQTVTLPVPTEIDELDYNWGAGSALRFELPITTLNPLIDLNSLPLKNDFSIRFTKLKRFKEGYYRFHLKGDDGIRLYVDDRLVINAWKNQPAQSYTEEHYLTGGDHVLRVEYYENQGSAVVELDIEPIHFTYEIFTNDSLFGDPANTFIDTKTRLEWRHVPPAINSQQPGVFSLRSKANLFFKGGTYQFHALHTGGCRIWVANQLVLDDWNQNNASGNPVTITKGTHQVKVEYRHLDIIPQMGSKTYYRAALHFGWSEQFWLTDVHQDPIRWDMRKDSSPDINYVVFRNLALTGKAKLIDQYQDGSSEPWRLNFNKIDKLLNNFSQTQNLKTDQVSVHMRRRIFIAQDGYYNAKLQSDDGHRLSINGKQLIEDHHTTGPDPQNKDVWLKAGFHDVAIEYANMGWSARFTFELKKTEWDVTYYDGINFDTFIANAKVNDLSDLPGSRPSQLANHTYSAKAKRTVWLPVGRYRFHIKGDDGVILKINGIKLIDGWKPSITKNYSEVYEHQGGNITIEVDYFQNTYSAFLGFQILPEGYLGEYYRGTTLEKAPEGSDLDRNVPAAYRFEPVIDFDWGAGNRLDRVGSNNFSARWWGKVPLPVGRYRIELKADDGVRLFIDGKMVINEWKVQKAKTHTKRVDLVGRYHNIRLEYFEQSGSAVCKLRFVREF
ncbi:PA14 domain-containing protein [Aquimarina sp. MMG016]|uniref:PA14 domain-containing protein n=1 Tax=Aquimarina sp. MMG016 TaxID=2822690 RepID=UPI001B3A397F|nr:PA14 domain-containing protein [Aquimarina sp. MMG016]MBQ4822594.1 hypothetical protein [Aquimarina sp. MMG016]